MTNDERLSSIRALIAHGADLDAAIVVVEGRGEHALGLVEVGHFEDAEDSAVAAAGAAVCVIDIDMAARERFTDPRQGAGLVSQFDRQNLGDGRLQIQARQGLARGPFILGNEPKHSLILTIHHGKGDDIDLVLRERGEDLCQPAGLVVEVDGDLLASFHGKLLPSCCGLSGGHDWDVGYCKPCARTCQRETRKNDEAPMTNAETTPMTKYEA